MNGIVIHHGDVREVLPTLADESVNCVVTSPPYWGLRDYGVVGQLGLERTPEEYISKMVAVFREVRRVLRADGTLWLNMGDSYSNDTKWGGSSGGKNYTSALGGYQGQRVRRGKDCDPKRGNAAPGQPLHHGYSKCKPKDLCGIPWLLAFALRTDGWYLRQDIIWSKPNPMPESVTDRCTKAHEYIFLLSKSERYYYDQKAVLEPVTGGAHARGDGVNPKCYNGSSFTEGKTAAPRENVGQGPRKSYSMPKSKQNPSFSAAGNELVEARNKRSVWSVATQPFPDAHFATFPEELIKPCILAGCPAGGTVLDPFGGSGTTALVARDNGCKAILVELSAEYIEIAKKRLSQEVLNFAECREEEI